MVGWLVVVVAGNGTGVSFSTCQPSASHQQHQVPPAAAAARPTLPNLPSHFLSGALLLHGPLFWDLGPYGDFVDDLVLFFWVPILSKAKTLNFLPNATFSPFI